MLIMFVTLEGGPLLCFILVLFSRQMRDYLYGFQEQCDSILDDVNSALQHLESLQKQYLFVSTKTGTLHEACEQLLKEQVMFGVNPEDFKGTRNESLLSAEETFTWQ